MKSAIFSKHDSARMEGFKEDLKLLLSLSADAIAEIPRYAAQALLAPSRGETEKVCDTASAALSVPRSTLDHILDLSQFFLTEFMPDGDGSADQPEDIAADLEDSGVVTEEERQALVAFLSSLRQLVRDRVGEEALKRRHVYSPLVEIPQLRAAATVQVAEWYDLEMRSKAIEDRFKELVNRWKRDTQFCSSPVEMAMNGAYQQIIGMGPAAAPLILRELLREPDHWFWALQAITGEDPVRPSSAGRLEEMATAWLEWGKSRCYV